MTPQSESIFSPMIRPNSLRLALCGLLLCLVTLALTGCQPIGLADGSAAAAADAPPAQPTLSPAERVPPLPTAAPAATTPVRLEMPAIGLDVPVVPMGWVVSTTAGLSVTWELPIDAAGWHLNSAPAGGPGNTVISGSQMQGDAVFAPLALGDVAVGQDLLLTDSAGNTFTYRVTQVLDPLPLRDNGADATAKALVEQAGVTRLTLITGWPAFTTTHRQFVVAEQVGE